MRIFLLGFVSLLFLGCSSTQISSVLKTADKLTSPDEPLTTPEVIAGLKEALTQGAIKGTETASAENGYFGNAALKIPFPPEISEVETKLRQIGLNKLVDDFVLSMNRAAEKAATEATPIFTEAIMDMTIQDAWGILRGSDIAATEYLRRTTSTQLATAFEPIISDALNSTNATRYYTSVTTAYNKIPFVTQVETDLPKYATDRAIDGLFILIAREEQKIREDPLERTTDLLRRVFGFEE